MMRGAFAVAAVLVLAAPTGVPAQSVAGRWTTAFDIGIRNENGVETSTGKRSATMTLTVHGDSILGTWQSAAADGTTPPPVGLRGVWNGGNARLQSDPVAHTVRMNDNEMKVHMVSYYAFQLRGDSLVGTTHTSDAEGTFQTTDRPFSAKRIP